MASSIRIEHRAVHVVGDDVLIAGDLTAEPARRRRVQAAVSSAGCTVIVRSTPSRQTSASTDRPITSPTINRCRSRASEIATPSSSTIRSWDLMPARAAGLPATTSMTSTPWSRPTAVATRGGRGTPAARDPDVRALEPPRRHQRVHDAAGGVVDRDREAEPDTRDGRVDPDDPSASVGERSARVPGVERGVGLDDVLDDAAGLHREGAAEGADHPRRDRPREPHRVADRDDELTDAEARGLAELRRLEAAAVLQAEHRQIRRR